MRIFWLATLLLVTALNVQARELTFYVATNGNDAWSGRNAVSAHGSTNGPLATLPAALAAAIVARTSATPGTSIKILLHGGRYELDAPIVLTPADSGSDVLHPLSIGAYHKEHPLLSGGHRITDWKPVPNQPGVWSAELPAAGTGGWCFHDLFVNGQRKQRARLPHEGFYRIDGGSPEGTPAQFHFHPGEIKAAWAQQGDVEVIAMLAWSELRMKIRAVDETNHVVTLSSVPKKSNKESNARYFIENAADAPDQPGEWRVDQVHHALIYRAEPGENPNEAEVIIPLLDCLLEFKGDVAAQKSVHDIRIEGLELAHTQWCPPAEGHADTQAEVEVSGSIRGEAAVDCVITHCRFEHLGGYALDFGIGCRRVSITGNDISDIGAGGLRLGETETRTKQFELCESNTISDNHIHALGRVYPAGEGVAILRSGGNLIAHNEINDLFYTAISVGWNWGYEESPCRDNRIEFNHLHDIGQGMLSDMGGIYTLGIQRGTVIRNNLIHDVSSFTYGGWGIYPDEGSSYILIENNVVYRTKSAGFHQHYGRENIVRNNIFAFGKEFQAMRTRAEKHLSFTITNNIFYFDSGGLLGGNWSGKGFAMDKNLYFDARPGANAASMRFAGKTFADWQREGHDVNSMIADPDFIAPAKYDFRLRRDSPALKLGFHPIDLRAVGVRPGK